MNRNPDRTLLTNEQLAVLAVEALTTKEVSRDTALAKVANATADLHNPNLIRSFLLEVSMDLRFEMFTRGELVLDTSDMFVPKPERPANIDPWFFERRVTSV